MDGILDEVRQMNTQVATILDMAKAEDVDTKLKKTEVDLTGIVDTVAQIYNEKISEKNVQIDIILRVIVACCCGGIIKIPLKEGALAT